MQKSQVYAKQMKARISPKKVAPVMNLVRDKDLERAKTILAFDPTKAAKIVLKVLKSAESNALHNAKMKKENLFLSEIWVSGGPMQKSGRMGGRSHFRPILKRTSHVYIGLAERSN